MSFNTGSFPVMADGIKVGKVDIEQNGLLLVFNCTCNYKSDDILRLAAVCGGKYAPLGVMMPYVGRPGVLRFQKSFTKNALASIGYQDAAAYHLIRPGDIYSETGDAEPPVPEEEAGSVLSAEAHETIVYNDFPDPVEYEYDFEPEPLESAGHSEPAVQELAPEPEPVSYQQEPAHEVSHGETETPQAESAAADTALSAASGWMTISNPGTLFNDPGIQEYCEDVSNALITEQDGYTLLAIPVSPAEPFPFMPVFCFGSSGTIAGQDYILFKIKNGNLIL